MKFYCEKCDEDVKVNADGECVSCGNFLDIDEDVLVSGIDPNDFTEVDEGGDGYGNDWDYDDTIVQEYE